MNQLTPIAHGFESWFEPSTDFIGNLHENFDSNEHFLTMRRKPVREIAPKFCQLFGGNVYMARKYVRFDYPIYPAHGRDELWLFPANGPAKQDDLVELEKRIGHTCFFQAAFTSHALLYNRAARVEKILHWAKNVTGCRIKQWQPTFEGDLTSADSPIIESIIAFLASSSAGLPASSVEFTIASSAAGKTPEFVVNGKDWDAVIEVKHFMKFPQSEAEEAWLQAFQRYKSNRTRNSKKPIDQLWNEVQDELNKKSEGRVGRFDMPYQKRAQSVLEQIQKAHTQLRSKGGKYKIIVLHSDDPHTFTTSEDNPNLPENRIERAVDSFLDSNPTDVDAVVVIASPFGFPIASQHHAKIFHRRTHCPEPVQLLFGKLPLLHATKIETGVIGADVTVPKNGTATVEIKTR